MPRLKIITEPLDFRLSSTHHGASLSTIDYTQRYQKTNQYPYPGMPRPSQTRAASFKRLYRK